MSVLKITLTEDMLKLISNIHYGEVPQLDSSRHTVAYGIDFNSLYGGSTLEDVAYIIGRYDEHIPGTEEDALGADFPKELKDYMFNMHVYIVDHIQDIEELVHWFSNKGGLKPGTYKCKSHERIWEREED
jgi:hypothetical protein